MDDNVEFSKIWHFAHDPVIGHCLQYCFSCCGHSEKKYYGINCIPFKFRIHSVFLPTLGSPSSQHGTSPGRWRESLQLWSLAASILNNLSRIADKGWSSSLEVGCRANRISVGNLGKRPLGRPHCLCVIRPSNTILSWQNPVHTLT